MKITFPCPGCGKKLKAHPDSVGRTRKCPVCATRVTCLETVVEARYVDAEVVEAEVFPAAPKAVPANRRGIGVGPGTGAATSAPAPAPALNPFADIGDDPYQLASPAPVTTSTPEAQKPCPICGEMILASAVKCRYCGEVFDPKLKKGKSKKRRKSSSGGGSSSTGARDVGIGILCMVAGIGLTIASLAYASGNDNAGGRFVVFTGLILGGFVQMCRGFYGMIRSGF